MDSKLQELVTLLLDNVNVLNGEIARLARTEQFTRSPDCLRLVKNIRRSCLCSLRNMRTVERRLRTAHNERPHVFPLRRP